MTGQPTEATRIAVDLTAMVDRLVPFADEVDRDTVRRLYNATVGVVVGSAPPHQRIQLRERANDVRDLLTDDNRSNNPQQRRKQQ